MALIVNDTPIEGSAPVSFWIKLEDTGERAGVGQDLWLLCLWLQSDLSPQLLAVVTRHPGWAGAYKYVSLASQGVMLAYEGSVRPSRSEMTNKFSVSFGDAYRTLLRNYTYVQYLDYDISRTLAEVASTVLSSLGIEDLAPASPSVGKEAESSPTELEEEGEWSLF